MKDRHGLTAKQEIVIEVSNAITHGVGILLSIIGLVLLILKAKTQAEWDNLAAYSIYGISMVLLFTNSTLYHSFSFSKYRAIFQKLDHAAIYLLIAGTYTPYLVVAMKESYRFYLLALIWILALTGLVIEVLWTNKFPKISTWMYLGLGWLSLLILWPLTQEMSLWGILLLAIGGILYSLGTIFYRMKHRKWMHVVWHIFVLSAAVMMYLSILFFV